MRRCKDVRFAAPFGVRSIRELNVMDDWTLLRTWTSALRYSGAKFKTMFCDDCLKECACVRTFGSQAVRSTKHKRIERYGRLDIAADGDVRTPIQRRKVYGDSLESSLEEVTQPLAG